MKLTLIVLALLLLTLTACNDPLGYVQQELRWLFWMTFGPDREFHTMLAIPCPTCGQLHQVDDCHGQAGEPVMLPEGARIVQPRAQRKPARRRWRLDLTEYAGQITAEDVRELVRAWIAGRDGELEQD